MKEETDFVNRCMALTQQMVILNMCEGSDKVWAAVLVEQMRSVIERQPYPIKSLEQIIEVLISMKSSRHQQDSDQQSLVEGKEKDLQ